jgi:hypothetical protein
MQKRTERENNNKTLCQREMNQNFVQNFLQKNNTWGDGWLSVKRHATTAATWVRIQPLNTQFKEAWSAHPPH